MPSASQTSAGFVFHREKLAQQYCDALSGDDVLVDRRSGLFLAAPRRTGKTFFILHDLQPAMQNRGWYTVYIDLWKSRELNAAAIVRHALIDHLRSHGSKLLQTLKAHVRSVNLARLIEIDFAGEKADETPISDLLYLLREASGKRIGLILDEAQQAIMQPSGQRVMVELKSARDQMNSAGGDMNLYLVFTGSSRDKLARMVVRHSEPFYGSTVLDFPLLGAAFVEAYAAWINARLDDARKLNRPMLLQAFEIVGARPDELKEAVIHATLDAPLHTATDQRLIEGARIQRDRRWSEFERIFLSLPPLPQVVLRALVKEGERFSPFAQHNLEGHSTQSSEAYQNSSPRKWQTNLSFCT